MSTGKRIQRSFDTPFPGSVGHADPLSSTAVNPPAPLSDGVAPPAPPAPPAPLPIGTPQNLHLVSTTLVESGTVGKWFAVVAWDAVDGAARYHLEWSPLGFGGAVIPIETTTASATFEVYMNRSYDVRVYAVSSSGARSVWSSTLTFLSDIDPTAPGQPTDVSAVFADSGDLIVSWTPGTGAQLKDTLVDLFASAVMTGPALRRFAVTGHTFTWSLKDNLAIGGLTDVWVRLSSRSYAGVMALPVTPAVQPSFAVPAAPTVTPSWNLQTGAMTLVWSISPRAVKYEVYVDGALQPQQITNRYVYSLDQNKAAHGGNPYQFLSYGIQGWDVFGRVGTQTAGSTSAPFPPDPTAATSEFDGPDALLGWSESVPVASFDLVIDGVTRSVTSTQYLYSFARNASEHSGVADPVLTCTVRARSILNMVSNWLTVAATNPAPSAPSAVVAVGGMAQIAVAATVALPPDLRDLSYRIVKDGATLTTILSQSKQLTYSAPSSGSYQIGVSVVDVFGQSSSETLSSAVVLDVLTVADLRAGTTYTDDNGSSAATLALLKDDIRIAPGVTYPGAARITTATRPQADRIRRITLAASGGQGYLSTSSDGATWQYFAGPLTGGVLTAAASQAAAAAAPVALPLNGSWDLPSLVECRIVQLHHSGIGGVGYALYEFYPRRLIESDDVRAEAIKAIHIGAGEVTADKLSVLSLSAVAAATGTLDVSGVLTIGAAGQIVAGAGNVRLDAGGIKVVGAVSGLNVLNAYQVVSDTGVLIGALYGFPNTIQLETAANGSAATLTRVAARSNDGATVQLAVSAPNGSAPSASINVVRSSSASSISMSAQQVYVAASGFSLTTSGATVSLPEALLTGPTVIQIGQTTGNGDAYIRNRTATNNNQFICITGGPYQDFFSTTNAASGAQIRLNGNGGIFGYGNLDLMAGGGSSGQINLFTDQTARMQIAKTGEIGINRGPGTSAASPYAGVRLSVQGQNSGGAGAYSYTLATYNGAGANTFYIKDNGAGYISGTLTQGSDRRYKTAIEPISAADLDALRATRFVQYDRIDGPAHQFGVIADEVLHPSLGSTNDDGYQAVNYIGYIALFGAFIQQLDLRLAALEARAA